MADWNQLLSAIEYRQREPERQAANEMRMLQLQAMKDKVAQANKFKSFVAELNAPTSPERTETIPDEAVNSSLADASSGLSKYGIQLDPSLQGQATQTKTIPAQYLSEPEKMVKMANYYVSNGDLDNYKKMMEGLKIQKEMSGVNNVVWSAWDAAKGDHNVFRQILLKQGATPEQINDIDTSSVLIGAMGSKSHGIYMNRDGKIQNLPTAKNEAWSDPYEVSIGGKKVLVKKNLGTNEVKPISADISTTVHLTGSSGQYSFPNWDERDKKTAYETKMITGKDPAWASRDSVSKGAFQKGYNEHLRSIGVKASDIALMQTDYKAGDMTLKNMSKQEAPMNAFVLNINKQVDKLQKLFAEAERTGLRLADVPLRDLRVKAKGSGKEAVLASYLLEVSNEIGKLSSGASASVQQLSDSAKEDWKKVHDVNLSMKEIMYVLNATKDQANMRMTAWREAKEAVRNNIRNVGGSAAPSSQPQETPTQPKATHKYIPGQGIVEIK